MASPQVVVDDNRVYHLHSFFGENMTSVGVFSLMELSRALEAPVDEPVSLENSGPLWRLVGGFMRLKDHFEALGKAIDDGSLVPDMIAPFDSWGPEYVFAQLTDSRIGVALLPTDCDDSAANRNNLNWNCDRAWNRLTVVVDELLGAMEFPHDLVRFADFRNRVAGYCAWFDLYICSLLPVE